MKVNVFRGIPNSGILTETNETIDIRKGRWISNETSHPMEFVEKICFENKNVYYLYFFGEKSSTHGVHISLNFLENQKFKWLQNIHWLQKEENIRYIINIFFLIGGLTLGILNLLK